MEHFLKAAEEAMGTGWVAGANYPNDFEHWTIKERALACLDPLFFQALGKARGWGQEIYSTDTGEEWGTRTCLHCGTPVDIQPLRESGCNHAHYPEGCAVCSKKAMTWEQTWLLLIRHLAAGGSIEDYFKTLV